MCVNDTLVWYLRANHPEERQRWVDVLKSYKVLAIFFFIYSFIMSFYQLIVISRQNQAMVVKIV